MDYRTFAIALGSGLGGMILGTYIGLPEVGVILSISYIGSKIVGILYDEFGYVIKNDDE